QATDSGVGSDGQSEPGGLVLSKQTEAMGKTTKTMERLPLLVSKQVDAAADAADKGLHRRCGGGCWRLPGNDRVKGMILVAMSAFTFSLLSTLIKFESRSMSSMETVFWRSSVALVLNLMAVRAAGVSLHVPKKHRMALLSRCAFGSCSMSMSFYAMQQMVLADASVLIFTSPIITFFLVRSTQPCAVDNFIQPHSFSLGAAVLGERIDPASLGCALFSFVGVICVVRPTFLFGEDDLIAGSNASAFAVACALLGAATQAVVYVSMRHLKQLHFMVVIHYFLTAATLLSALSLAIVQREFVIPLSLGFWLAMLGTGFLGFVGQLCLTRGFQLENAGPASVMRYLDIVFVFIWDTVLLRERINVWSVAGAIIITGCAGVCDECLSILGPGQSTVSWMTVTTFQQQTHARTTMHRSAFEISPLLPDKHHNDGELDVSLLSRLARSWCGQRHWQVDRRVEGMGLVAISALTFSLLSTLVKFEARVLPSMETVFWRPIVALALNMVAVRMSGETLYVAPQHRVALFWRCVFGATSMSLCYYAMQQLVLADASVLIFTCPIMTFFLVALVLGEKIDPTNRSCAVLSFVGVVCVVRPIAIFGIQSDTADTAASTFAVMCAILGAVTQAAVYVCMRHLRQVHFLVVIHYFLVAGCVLSGLSLLFVDQRFLIPTSWTMWLAMVGTGFLGFIAQICLTRGFQLEKAGPASVMRYLDIVFVFLWDTVLLGERINAWSTVGAVPTRCAELSESIQYTPSPSWFWQGWLDSLTHAGSGKRRRARTDPDAPKPYKNPYIHFSTEKRRELSEQRPDWTVQQVSSEIGRLWKSMAAGDKKPWVELAQFDKARFQTELDQYLAQRPKHESQDAAIRRVHIPHARKKGKYEPKPPDTAYICFSKAKRRELVMNHPEMPAQTVSREVGRLWKALTHDERQLWDEVAAADRIRYERELAEFEQPAKLLKLDNKMPGVTPIKDPYAPKAPKTAFQLFMAHNRESFALLNMSINEFRVEMSQLWKRMTERDKKPWQEMAKQDKLRYDTEMANYKPPAYLSSNAAKAQRRLEELKRAAREDPDAPRLPQTAYNFFAEMKRKEIEFQMPHLKYGEVIRMVGEAWKELGPHDRLPFARKAEKDVVRFEMEMEEYQSSRLHLLSSSASALVNVTATTQTGTTDQTTAEGGDAQAAAGKKKKTDKRRKKDPRKEVEKPKKAQSAYNLFYNSRRGEVQETYQMTHNQVSALMGRMWRQMSEEDRQPYYRMAEEDKVRYEVEKKEYDAKIQTIDDQEQHDRLAEMQITASAGFRYFQAAKLRENAEMPLETILEIWKSLSEPHQNLWEELAADHLHDVEEETERQRQEEEVRRRQEEEERRKEEQEMAKIVQLPGFRYFVETKKSDREQLPMNQLVRIWQLMSEPHRQLWEELASEHLVGSAPEPEDSVAQQQEASRRAVADLDALCGFPTTGNPVNAFV
ncbi:TPA: LOW QUALITY PROTEIN: hypothetical protein N0F65_006110, partial [Lagenidium giganteum]